MSEVTREQALTAIYIAVASTRDSVREITNHTRTGTEAMWAVLRETPTLEDIARRLNISPHVFAAAKSICEYKAPEPPLELWAGEPAPRDIKKGEVIVLKFKP